jgi:hypothetical protein
MKPQCQESVIKIGGSWGGTKTHQCHNRAKYRYSRNGGEDLLLCGTHMKVRQRWDRKPSLGGMVVTKTEEL